MAFLGFLLILKIWVPYIHTLFTEIKNLYSLSFCCVAKLVRFRKYIGNPIHLKIVENLKSRITMNRMISARNGVRKLIFGQVRDIGYTQGVKGPDF